MIHITERERSRFTKLLEQPEIHTFYITCLLTVAQLSLASAANDDGLLFWTLKVVLFGAPITQVLYVATTEYALNLSFGIDDFDRWAGIFSNLSTGVPYSELVRHFFIQHLVALDTRDLVDPEDADQKVDPEEAGPTGADPEEAGTYRTDPEEADQKGGRVWLKKLTYPALHWAGLVRRSYVLWTRYLIWNVGVQVLFDVLVWRWLGFWSLVYMLVSTYVGVCPLHPCASHMWKRHDSVKKTAISTYGILNAFTMNAGYHRERHAFTHVPWSGLRLIHQMYRS